MSHDDLQRIHESEETARDAKRRQKWDAQAEFEPQIDSLRLATRICGIGTVIPVILSLVWMLTAGRHSGSLTNQLAGVFCAAVGWALIYAPMGAACGLVAHRICRNTSIPERHLAVGLALVVVCTALGWLIWLLLMK